MIVTTTPTRFLSVAASTVALVASSIRGFHTLTYSRSKSLIFPSRPYIGSCYSQSRNTISRAPGITVPSGKRSFRLVNWSRCEMWHSNSTVVFSGTHVVMEEENILPVKSKHSKPPRLVWEGRKHHRFDGGQVNLEKRNKLPLHIEDISEKIYTRQKSQSPYIEVEQHWDYLGESYPYWLDETIGLNELGVETYRDSGVGTESLQSPFQPLDLAFTNTGLCSDEFLPSLSVPKSLKNIEQIASIRKDSNTDISWWANKKTLRDDIWKARLLLFGAAALYGTNFALVKILDDYIPVGASTSLRFGLASLASLPWLLSRASDQSIKNSVEERMGGDVFEIINCWWAEKTDAFAEIAPSLVAGMEVGLWTAIGYISQAIGLQVTDASKSAFICSLAVVVVPLLDALTGKSLKPRALLGVLCAILGVGMLELNVNPTDFFARSPGVFGATPFGSGDLFTFVQPLAFGVGFWRMEEAMHKYPTEASRLTAGQLLSVALLSIAYCWAGGGVGEVPPSWEQIWSWVSDPIILVALFWTGVVTTALTVYMETMALKSVSAAEATLIFSTEPIWGAAFASLVVGETLGVSAVSGAALILSGCAVSAWDDGNIATVNDGEQ